MHTHMHTQPHTKVLKHKRTTMGKSASASTKSSTYFQMEKGHVKLYTIVKSIIQYVMDIRDEWHLVNQKARQYWVFS